MNTTQLECFMSVANFLNFSRAAEQLRLTQPAVGHQINTLEDELGAKLFYRTSKRVRLTQEGHLFSQYAREILSLSRASRARLKESQETSVVRFGIGCRSFLELRLLTPVLRALREEMPNLLPVLRLVPFDSLENQLEDGEVQVIFTFQESAPKRAVYRELTLRRAVCLCAAGSPLAAHDRLTVQQLRGAELCFAAHPPTAPRPPCYPSRPRSSPAAVRTSSISPTTWRPCTLWWRPATPLPWPPSSPKCPCPPSGRSRWRAWPPSPTGWPTPPGTSAPRSADFRPI